MLTSIGTKSSNIIKYQPNKIIDFQKYYKYLTLTDNEFLYYKRVGSPIEFSECAYQDINASKSLTKTKSLKSKSYVEFLTISKNVTKLI